ncbi:retrovirus-related Pol polyprotein from transposon 17.6 [Trichonephila clavipes]|nr:retrovirus-related Pol polyprotein from transposon 17.6 [Trichonephila clavipes]
MPGHIKAVCPKLIKNKTTETLNNIEGNENPDFLNSYTTKGSVNGHEIDILRDMGANIDLVCAKYINPPFFSVEILNAVQTRSQVKTTREERGIDSGDAKKGEVEAIIVSSDAEDEIFIPALQEYVPELALLRVTRENLINAQKNSEEIKSLYEQAASQVQVTNQVYSLEKELLVKNRENKLGNVVKLIVVPEGLRDPIKSLCHEGTSAHLGITKSKDKLNRYFYWPNCYRDMEQFVNTCDQCQRAGKPNDKKKAPLKLVPVIQEVFTKLNIDACGPLPITSKRNRYLITAICMSSKFPEAIPVSDISSVSVTDALLNIFSRMGFPLEIQCDQGTSFTSALTTEFFERFGILVRQSSVYHPQSNPVERLNRTLKRLLRVLCLDSGSECDKHLPSILLALRTVSHESTGYTPSELVYGKNLQTPETLVMEHWMEPGEEGDLVTEYMFKLINRLKRCQEVAINKMEEMQVKRKTWDIGKSSKTAQRDAAFCTSFGTYRPLRMSFGLKNAPYFFSKLMAELLNGLEERTTYLDDIAIFSDIWESHLKHVETVLQRIKRSKLTIKPSKCKFAQQNVKFLGLIVGQGFRTPSEVKVQAILEFPTPHTKTQILGLAGYYQKRINLFSVIAAPLTDALKGRAKKGRAKKGRAKKGEIMWTTEGEDAFREQKGKQTDKPVLYAPNFERELIVQTDASNAGESTKLPFVFEAVREINRSLFGVASFKKVDRFRNEIQLAGHPVRGLNEQGEEHPILYLSKKFSEVEKHYCTTEKECASIVFAIKRLHYYLDGNSFLVMTDHNPLVWLNRNVSSNPRLMRWALALQPYNFRIVHRSGKSHKNAESLSRSVIDN